MENKTLVRVRLALMLLCVGAALASGLFVARPSMRSRALANSETVVFRQGLSGYAGCTDTRISAENPDANFGDGELILGMKGRVTTLVRFDVSRIPTSAFVQDAKLSLAVVNFGQRGDEPIIVASYPVTRTWAEMEATWNRATNAAYWGLPGCNNTSNDRSPISTDSRAVYNIGWYTWTVTSAVQAWVQSPASNKGLALRQTNVNIGGEFDIRQSEYPGLDWRPYLVVTYTLATPTPSATPIQTGTPPTPVPLPCVGIEEPGAVLLVLQQGIGYSGAEDTWFNFDDRETRYASEWFMHVGYRRHYSGLVRFNLSGIPQGSRIVCAALSLFAERWSGKPLAVGDYYVKRGNSVSQATWTWATSVVPWQMGGCNGPDDRSQTPESIVSVDTIYAWYHFDLTRVVDGWINGSLANHGVSLQAMDELDTDTVWFTASDDAAFGNRPKLVVLYVPPSGPLPTRTRTATPTRTSVLTPTRTPTPTRTAAASTRTDTFHNGLDGYVGCRDTRISAESPAANFGTSDLKVGARQRIATLLSFDLTSIPSNATVASAELSLYGYYVEGDGGWGLEAYAVRRPWREDQASWNAATASTPWGLSGCASTLNDRTALSSATVTVGMPGWYKWSVPQDVQRMVSQPGTNAGWLLHQGSELPGVLYMRSSEYDQASFRPKLVVTYSLP